MNKRVVIIGAGFSGLSAAAFLARAGFEVNVIEKNTMPGGRARKFEANGFTFDMGPSWYWMPDVIDKFFTEFGRKTNDYFELKRLDPSYRVYFGKDDFVEIPSNVEDTIALFESMETGAGKKLQKFLIEAERKYTIGINQFASKPSLSVMEFAQWKLLKHLFAMQLFRSFHSHVARYFKNPRIHRLLEFPILFLGGTGNTTPALYSLMNFGDLKLGTWYPMGGMYELVDAMHKLATEMGATFRFETEAKEVEIKDGVISAVITNKGRLEADYVIGAGDYHYIEQNLLPEKYRMYSTSYWHKRVMSPSSLIFYIGLDKKLEGFRHHTLLFDTNFDIHAAEIYGRPRWPSDPALYVSATSKTDPSVAPDGQENLMVLIPVATGLDDSEATREHYFEIVMTRLENISGQKIREHVVYKRSYAHNDFISDYHAFKGNAYGLANTLMQTAFLKPRMKSRKLKNLYFSGQLTVPGPGVPPAIMSGRIAAEEILKNVMR
jgi:phytoene desaturase